MFKQLQLNQCNLCLEKLYSGRQEDLTFQVILHFHLATHQVFVKSLPQPLAPCQFYGSKHSAITFPLLAFPIVPSLSGIMVASSKRKTFYYKQHPLNFVALSEFTGNANFQCLYSDREVQPQPGTVSCCFFHSSYHISLFSYH